jgi:hypothetical protein
VVSKSDKRKSTLTTTIRPKIDDRPSAQALLASIKGHLSALEKLLAECNAEWGADDAVYRFYHQSFEVYLVQTLTLKVVEALQALAPDRQLNSWFMQIVTEGTYKTFHFEDNQRWLEVTRPIIEAFFHARHFLTVVVQSAHELQDPPTLLPTNWATVLYLYDLR